MTQGALLVLLAAMLLQQPAILQGDFAGMMAMAAVIHVVVLGVLLAIARLWPVADRPVIVFCGGQKSIATGVLVVAALTGINTSEVAVILLPLIAYHVVQLIIDARLLGGGGNDA